MEKKIFKMKKKENLVEIDYRQLERYSPWIKINKKIEGPIFKFGLFYICLFLIITMAILVLKTELTQLQGIFHFIMFGMFLICVWLVFVGILLRSEK